MTLLLKLAELFDVRPGERHMVGTLMMIAFCMGLTFVFINVPAMGMFIEAFGSEGLPLLYIAFAIISTFIAFMYIQISSRVPFTTLLVLNVSFIFVGTVTLRVLLGVTDAIWPLFLLPIWFEVVTTVIWIGFGTLLNRLFDVRQGKRLMGVIRMMVPGANIFGGLFISVIAQYVDPRDIFAFSIISIGLLIALLVLVLLRTYGHRLNATQDDDKDGEQPSITARQITQNSFRRRYVFYIFALICIWWVGFYFIDNIFYDLAEEEFPTDQELTAFLGVFFGTVQGTLLLFGNFFASRVIGRIGMRTAALLMPVLVTLCIGLLITAEVLGAALTLIFVFGAAAKLANGALGFSVDAISRLLLYQPLPPEERSRTQAIGQGIVEPLSIGVVGFMLLILTRGYGLGATSLALIFIGVAVVWIGTVIVTFLAYPRALRQAIARRRLGDGSFEVIDAQSVRLLREELNDEYPEAVIYAMTLLETVDPDYLKSALPGLLTHAEPAVQQQALTTVERLHAVETQDAVKALITAPVAPEVTRAALSTLIALGGENIGAAAAVYLEHPNVNVQQGAVVGLLRHGGADGRDRALQKLAQFALDEGITTRLIVPRVASTVGSPELYEVLYPLLYDDDLDVRRAAVLAAGHIKHPDLWLDVLQLLTLPVLRNEATQALVTGGEDALPEIMMAFESSDDNARDLRRRLVRVMGRIGGPLVIDFLKPRIDYTDEEIRTAILNALTQGGYEADDPAERDRIEAQIEREARQMASLLTIYGTIDTEMALWLVADALMNDLNQTRDRVFDLLAFLYGHEIMRQAREALIHGNTEQRAYAVEVVDDAIPRAMRGYLLPLLDDTPLAYRLRQLVTLFGLPERSLHEHLRGLIRRDADDQNPWMTLYALYAASQLDDPAPVIDVVREYTSADDPLIREAATWALAQINDTTTEGDAPMYATIEKIVILKTIAMFEETPNDVLVDLAGLMDVVEVPEGITIFEKGDVGRSMYVIVNGHVRVHDGAVTLNTLGNRDVFGELALLDTEPRAATITTLEDTVLFRLDQEPFYELIADRGEVARGIMRVLARTIRQSAQSLSSLGAGGRGEV